MFSRADSYYEKESIENIKQARYAELGAQDLDNEEVNDALIENDDQEEGQNGEIIGAGQSLKEKEESLPSETNGSETGLDVLPDFKNHNRKPKDTLFSIFVDVSFLLLAFTSILIVALLRGGHGVKSIIGLETCSVHSWFFLLVAQLICISCSMINRFRHLDHLVGREGSQDYETKSKKSSTHLLWTIFHPNFD